MFHSTLTRPREQQVVTPDLTLVARSTALVDEDVLSWRVASTSANHEKRVAEQLRVRELECFLPTYESLRQWNDRRVWLQLPLFPGYVFVRMCSRDRLRVVQVPGIARLVGFNGTMARLPDEEIEALKNGLATGVRAEPHRFLTVGRRVRVSRGPLKGMKGILLSRKRHTRFIISIELIMRSVAVEIDETELEPVETNTPQC